MKVKFDSREGLPAIYNRAIAHVQPQGASYVVYDDRNSAAQLIVKDGIGVTVNLFVPAVELSATAAGTGGFVINGQCAGDKSGNSVSAAGDVNGDGLADLIVGATFGDSTGRADAGRSYVIFGATSRVWADRR